MYAIDAAPVGGRARRRRGAAHGRRTPSSRWCRCSGCCGCSPTSARQRLGKLLELNETYRGTALLLGDVIAADDNYTGEHSEGVVGLALAVGDALGLDPERRRNLEFGAMLHDVGKITIPKEIINKPGKLDPHEWEIIKTHPAEGQRMLDRVGGFMVEVGEIVRAHHERWDGGGYPDGLAGEGDPARGADHHLL